MTDSQLTFENKYNVKQSKEIPFHSSPSDIEIMCEVWAPAYGGVCVAVEREYHFAGNKNNFRPMVAANVGLVFAKHISDTHNEWMLRRHQRTFRIFGLRITIGLI